MPRQPSPSPRRFCLAPPCWSFEAQLGDLRVVSMCVGARADPYVLAIEGDPVVGPVSRHERARRYVILGAASPAEPALEIHDQRVLHGVQPLPGGGWLVVGARAALRRGVAERNAAVLDGYGAVRRTLALGDGIADVQVDPDGSIWCSYFDEGVFGNLGWGTGPGTTPVGAGGLVRFDLEGKVLFDYGQAPDAPSAIADCYALNVVSAREVWLHYYTDFPLVRVRAGKVEHHGAPARGAHAIAVGHGHVALLGGYDEPARCQLFRLGERALMPVADFHLHRSEAGEPLGHGIGRGDSFYFLHGASVCRLRLTVLLV